MVSETARLTVCLGCDVSARNLTCSQAKTGNDVDVGAYIIEPTAYNAFLNPLLTLHQGVSSCIYKLEAVPHLMKLCSNRADGRPFVILCGTTRKTGNSQLADPAQQCWISSTHFSLFIHF